MNFKPLCYCLAIALAFASAVCHSAGDPYLEDLSSAAASFEQADYDAAMRKIDSAFARRSGDPLAHAALGALLLQSRQYDRAYKEFRTANELVEDYPLALYGIGLYYLASKKPAAALEFFQKSSISGEYDASPAIAYASSFQGVFPQESESTDPVIQQVLAFQRLKKPDFSGALDALTPLASRWKSFDEDKGAIVTFDAAAPISFVGGGLKKPYKSPSEAEPNLRKVSGSITLRADAETGSEISYVLFSIDDAMIGMVNHAPYECIWDSTRNTNGPHTIKIQGFAIDGSTVSEKTMRVMVANSEDLMSKVATGHEVKLIERKFWNIMSLKPSQVWTYYTISKCAEARGDRALSLAAIEHAAAIDPTYKDSRSRLAAAYAPISAYRQIWKGNATQKLVALTFDDGPNADTNKLLDLLSQKGVKATFFVIGFRAEQNPDVMKRIASEGHQIENHTYSHRNVSLISNIEIEREILRGASVIRSITGHQSKLFRLPGGHENSNLQSIVGKYGFSPVFWTINCSKNEGSTKEAIIKQLAAEIKPGAIVLMHNLESVTYQALPKVIDDLKAKGYRMVTMNELLSK